MWSTTSTVRRARRPTQGCGVITSVRIRDDGLQTYTNSTDNARVDGQGHLVIQANQTANGYTSARLVTQDKLAMKYGVVQARIKMPADGHLAVILDARHQLQPRPAFGVARMQ